MRNQKTRLGKLHRNIESMPVTGSAVSTALDLFRQTGELPDHQSLAERTIEEALRLPNPLSLRETLLREATHELEPVRVAARTALRYLVAAGHDVASRNFLDEDMPLPKLGSVGLHLLGWPEILIRPPYEEQATRVIEHVNRLQPWLKADPGRTERLARFSARFFKTGDLPTDEHMRSAVLTYAEFLSLHRVLGGEEDRELLAAFDRIRCADKETKEAAVRSLQDLARAGRAP